MDPNRRLLTRENQPIPVQPKAFDILRVLVENSERVVLKEDLLKAVWPDTFVEESNLAQNIFVLRKTLGDAVGENRYIVTAPGRGYRFAEKVTEVSPTEESLIVQSQSIQTVTVTEMSRVPTRHLWVFAALLLLTGSIAGYRAYYSSRARGTLASEVSKIPIRRSVAVLGFRDLSGRPEDAWLSTALAEMLNTELAAGEKLRLIPGEDVARTKLDLRLPDDDSLSKDTLARLHNSLGSDMVVLGSYASLGGKSKGSIRLDLRLQDAVAGETIAEVATTGAEDDLFDLVSRAGLQLREKLGVGNVTMAEAVSVKASLPANPESARLYAEGLAKLRVFDAQVARDLLQHAVSLDPKYPLAHAALSEAWTGLGYDKKAKEEARQAYQLSANLSREERLLVEGSYDLANHEYEKAIDVQRTLFAIFPDNLDYGLRLANAEYQGSKPKDAIATIATLRKVSAQGSSDPRIDLLEAEAWDDASDFKSEQEPLGRALEQARAQGSRLLVAAALRQQCRNFSYLGQEEEAVAACREARDTYAAAGDRAGEASTLRRWADVIMQSDPPGAIALDQQALEVFRSMAHEGGLAGAMNSLGLLYHDRGDLLAAEKIHRQSQAIYRRIGDADNLGIVTGNIANDLLDQGNLTGAMKLYEEAAELNRVAGDTGSAATSGYNIASVQELRGDLTAAERGFEESLKEWQHNGDQYEAGFAWFSLGHLRMTESNFAGAHQALEKSLAIRKDAGDKVMLAETQMLLAELSLAEGRDPSLAEAAARQTIEDFKNEKMQNDEAQAWDLLSRALLERRKFEDARHAAATALDLSQKNRNNAIRMQVEITEARVRGLADPSLSRTTDRVAATRQLASVVTEAKKKGYFGVELEARLAAGEIEMKASPTPLAASHLAALESDARAKDFGLIAKRAAAARSPRN